MSLNPLPPNWERAKLSEIAVVTQGQSPPGRSYNPDSVGLPFLQGKAQFGSTSPIPDIWCSAPVRVAEAGDILISIRAPVGPTNIADQRYCIGRGLAAIRSPQDVSPLFLLYYLRHSVSSLVDQATGTTFDAIRGEVLRAHSVLVPPTGEQRRIVEAIDSYLTRLDDAVASLERVKAQLKAYRGSVLKAAVEGRLVLTEASLALAEKRDYERADVLLARMLIERRRRWEEAELARLKAAGKIPKDDKWKAKYQEPEAADTNKLPELPEGWCWASPGQVFSWASGEFLPKKAQRDGAVPVFGGNGVNGVHNKALIEAPTIVVGRVGAQCGNLHLTLGPSWITDNAIYAVAPIEEVNLGYWLISMGHQNLNANAGGTGQPYVNQKHLNELRVPLPPASEQSRIVAVADALLSGTQHTEKEISLSVVRCNRLRQAVLKWAFEGKLVDQDPTDEPAEKLLARLRAERASVGPAKPSRGRKARGAA